MDSCGKRFGGTYLCRQSFGAALTHLAQGLPFAAPEGQP